MDLPHRKFPFLGLILSFQLSFNTIYRKWQPIPEVGIQEKPRRVAKVGVYQGKEQEEKNRREYRRGGLHQWSSPVTKSIKIKAGIRKNAYESTIEKYKSGMSCVFHTN